MLDIRHEMTIDGIYQNNNNFNTESFQYNKDPVKSELSSHLLTVRNYRLQKKVFNKVKKWWKRQNRIHLGKLKNFYTFLNSIYWEKLMQESLLCNVITTY